MSNTNTTDLLKSLNDIYQNQNYKEAIDLILKNKQTYNEAVFHEHLGTLYLKLHDVGAARYHLEKAIQKGLWGTRVRHNLNTAKTLVKTPDLDSTKDPLGLFVGKTLAIPSDAFVILTLLLMVILAFCVRFKKICNKVTIFGLFILSLTPVLYSKLYLSKVNYAVALKETSIYEGPSQIYTQISTLEPGVKFILGERRDGWFLIKYPENLVGWVRKSDIGLY